MDDTDGELLKQTGHVRVLLQRMLKPKLKTPRQVVALGGSAAANNKYVLSPHKTENNPYRQDRAPSGARTRRSPV